MSGEEKVVQVRATEIPGMRIIYQTPLADDGKGISYEAAVDTTISQDDLDELLDRVSEASRRQMAFDQIRISKESLHAAKKKLANALTERAHAIAMLNRHVERMSVNRRGPVDPTTQDANSVKQWDETVAAARNDIVLAEWRIPYWEAIRDRKTPPELPEIANDRLEAAE